MMKRLFFLAFLFLAFLPMTNAIDNSQEGTEQWRAQTFCPANNNGDEGELQLSVVLSLLVISIIFLYYGLKLENIHTPIKLLLFFLGFGVLIIMINVCRVFVEQSSTLVTIVPLLDLTYLVLFWTFVLMLMYFIVLFLYKLFLYAFELAKNVGRRKRKR